MSASTVLSFGRAAAGYRGHSRVQLAMADWLAEWLPMEQEGRALEIGAGTGLFTEKISGWPGGVTATDVSPAMCVEGARVLPLADWRVMAAEAPLAGPWAWIFSSSMLQWVLSPEEVFSAWRACLVPGGRVLAGLFVAESLPELRGLCDGYSPVEWRTPEGWRASLVSAGLRVVRDAVESRVFTYGSAREFLATLHGVGAAPRRRFTSGRMRRLLREYEEKFRDVNGVRATWTFYRFEAERVG